MAVGAEKREMTPARLAGYDLIFKAPTLQFVTLLNVHQLHFKN